MIGKIEESARKKLEKKWKRFSFMTEINIGIIAPLEL